jgi:hypothetical protein
MRKIPNLILLLSLGIIICGYSQSSPEIIADNFFSHLEAGNTSEAIKSLPVSSIIESDTSFHAKTVLTLNENEALFGKYCGYELIEKNEISESFITAEYLVKYTDAPRRVQFVFYKPLDKWQVNQVIINFRERPTSARNRPARRL